MSKSPSTSARLRSAGRQTAAPSLATSCPLGRRAERSFLAQSPASEQTAELPCWRGEGGGRRWGPRLLLPAPGGCSSNVDPGMFRGGQPSLLPELRETAAYLQASQMGAVPRQCRVAQQEWLARTGKPLEPGRSWHSCLSPFLGVMAGDVRV